MEKYTAEQFAESALVAMAGTVCTPAKGYMNDGGPALMANDIKQLTKRYKQIEALMSGAACVGCSPPTAEARIEYSNSAESDAAYEILGDWYRKFGPSIDQQGDILKKRRRELFFELLDEFQNEI